MDILQEAPYFFVSRVKSDSDSGVNRAEKKGYVGEPLANVLLFASVGETD